MISARTATSDDLTRISALAGMGINELRLIRGGAIWAVRNARSEPVESSLSAAIDDPDVFVTVGEIDGTVVGYSVTHIELLHDGSRLAVVDDIYVHPRGRAVSVGESMVDLIIGWASSQGCLGIDSMALPGDRDTKNFFETFGFKARAIVVHRPLATTDLSRTDWTRTSPSPRFDRET